MTLALMRPSILAWAALVLSVGCWAQSPDADRWPRPPLPPTARAESLGDELLINGARARLLRFDAEGTEQDVLAFFRTRFGRQRVEHTVQGRPVMATRDGDGQTFHTVQLTRTRGQHVEGLVMSTRPGDAPIETPWSRSTEAWLPTSSRVLNRLQSLDLGRRTLLLTAANQHSVQANREHLLRALQPLGFQLEHEAVSQTGPQGVSLRLASSGEHVVVTLSEHRGHRMVVLQRTMEPSR